MKMRISVAANNKKRTFTIRVYEDDKCFAKYRTTTMTRAEFDEASFFTENDWRRFLHSGDYYKVR